MVVLLIHYPIDVIDTVQSVHYSDSQCTVYTATILARASTLQLVAILQLTDNDFSGQYFHHYLVDEIRNCGPTDTVQTVQYSDSQCTLYTVTILARASTLQWVACRALLYSTTTFYTVRVLFYTP